VRLPLLCVDVGCVVMVYIDEDDRIQLLALEGFLARRDNHFPLAWEARLR